MDHIPGTKQMSTVISDAVLAAASFNCAWLVRSSNQLGALGLATIGLAASAGVMRFYGVRQAYEPHTKLTFLSTTTGMLLLALGFMVPAGGFPDLPTAVGIAAAAGAAAYFAVSQKPKLEEPVTMLFGLSFIGCALYKCVMKQHWAGAAGAVLFAASGLFGTRGEIKGIKKVDIFHYGLSGALFFIAQAMTETV